MLLDEIAYPIIAKPAMQQGVVFFNEMREQTAIGFFISKMGVQDLGYQGNGRNKWEVVPQHLLKNMC